MNISSTVRIIALLVIVGLVMVLPTLGYSGTALSSSVTSSMWFNVAHDTRSFVLAPSQPAQEATDTLSVKANKAGWHITVTSDTSNGKMYEDPSKATSLAYALNLTTSTITPGGTGVAITNIGSTSQELFTSTVHTQGQRDSTITYNQGCGWADDASKSYKIVLTFASQAGP